MIQSSLEKPKVIMKIKQRQRPSSAKHTPLKGVLSPDNTLDEFPVNSQATES